MGKFGSAFTYISGLLSGANPAPEAPPADNAITVTTAEFSGFTFYAQYSAAAYCNSQASPGTILTCSENSCPDVTAANATVLANFHGIATDAQGFVSSDDANQVIVVSIKGSESIRNWIADLSFVQVPCDLVDDCQIHSGFLAAYKEIEDDLLAGVEAAKAAHPSYKIVFTGHSLGGAVNTVAAAYARSKGYEVDLYTYGSPRVGNKEFVEFVTNQPGVEYRVTHLDDPVPRLPPIFVDYEHTNPEYWLSGKDANSTDYAAADIRVCEGFSNTDCNGGTTGLDVDAHLYYFEHISGCSQDDLSFRRRNGGRNVAPTDSLAVRDEQLLARVNSWAARDRELVAALKQ